MRSETSLLNRRIPLRTHAFWSDWLPDASSSLKIQIFDWKIHKSAYIAFSRDLALLLPVQFLQPSPGPEARLSSRSWYVDLLARMKLHQEEASESRASNLYASRYSVK